MIKAFKDSCGVRFGLKENHVRKVQLSAERTAFAEKCPSYGLSPSFYKEELLVNGEVFLLVGFSGEFAQIQDEDGFTSNILVEEAFNGLLARLNEELEEIPEKAELLYGDTAAAEKQIAEASNSVVKRMECIHKAQEIWNGGMAEVAAEMNLPVYAGWSDDEGRTYEFVSYRDGYVFEALDISSDDPNRYKTVGFEELVAGLKRYAEEAQDEESLEQLSFVKAYNTGADAEVSILDFFA